LDNRLLEKTWNGWNQPIIAVDSTIPRYRCCNKEYGYIKYKKRGLEMKTSNLLVLTICSTLFFLSSGLAASQDEVVIKVNGMFCPFCTFGIEKWLNKLPEVEDVRTDLEAGEAIAVLKPEAEFVREHYVDAIKRAGFTHSGITLRQAGTEPPKILEPSSAVTSENRDAPIRGNDEFRYIKAVGKYGSGPGEFDQPMSIAFAPQGWFVVTDAGNARIQQFHSDGRLWRQWSISGDGDTTLVKPVGVIVGSKGDIWVTDYEKDTINHYTSDGKPQGSFGTPGRGPGQMDAPSGLALTADGLLVVADFYNHRIQLFKTRGKFVRLIGAQGFLRRLQRDGLNYPTRVAVSTDGLLWVADAYNHRLVAFDSKGKLVRRFGKKGHKAGQFDVSSGIAFIDEKRLIAADFMNHRIQIWSTSGKFLRSFGNQGHEPGKFERPTDIAIAPDGNLYVVDWGNHRIQVFSLRGKTE
jgi:DNA-binding beta-propeller fold protein YncE/copper chaperone CopZ